jgi:hypothetical protein
VNGWIACDALRFQCPVIEARLETVALEMPVAGPRPAFPQRLKLGDFRRLFLAECVEAFLGAGELAAVELAHHHHDVRVHVALVALLARRMDHRIGDQSLAREVVPYPVLQGVAVLFQRQLAQQGDVELARKLGAAVLFEGLDMVP